jgi:hypothetical protein
MAESGVGPEDVMRDGLAAQEFWFEIRGQKSEVRDQKSEVRRPEVRRRKI